MIFRIMGEGQFQIDDAHLEELNALDDALEAALADPGAYPDALSLLLGRVRELGSPVPAEELVPSEVILPAAEATVEEVRAMFTDEGLIPD